LPAGRAPPAWSAAAAAAVALQPAPAAHAPVVPLVPHHPPPAPHLLPLRQLQRPLLQPLVSWRLGGR
jgi:hypothetical protein